MPVAWCVVTAWHLSSLLLMATKASALCGALPSTTCCECCFGALPSCTEVFTFRWSRSPLRTPLELHAPSPRPVLLPPPVLASSPLPPLAPCCWPPPAVFPLVPARSSAFSARFAACVFFGGSFVAPFLFGLLLCLLVVFLPAVAGLLLPYCCWICGLCLVPAYEGD